MGDRWQRLLRKVGRMWQASAISLHGVLHDLQPRFPCSMQQSLAVNLCYASAGWSNGGYMAMHAVISEGTKLFSALAPISGAHATWLKWHLCSLSNELTCHFEVIPLPST